MAFCSEDRDINTSIENETKASNGIAVLAGVVEPTEMMDGGLGGPTLTEREAQRELHASSVRLYSVKRMVEVGRPETLCLQRTSRMAYDGRLLNKVV